MTILETLQNAVTAKNAVNKAKKKLEKILDLDTKNLNIPNLQFLWISGKWTTNPESVTCSLKGNADSEYQIIFNFSTIAKDDEVVISKSIDSGVYKVAVEGSIETARIKMLLEMCIKIFENTQLELD